MTLAYYNRLFRALQRHLISKLDGLTDIAKLKRVVETWKEQGDAELKELIQSAQIEVKEVISLYILATEWSTEFSGKDEIGCKEEDSPPGYGDFLSRLRKGIELLKAME